MPTATSRISAPTPTLAPKEPREEFMTIREAANWMRVSPLTVRRLIAKKPRGKDIVPRRRLRKFKFCGRTLVLAREVRALAQEQQ